MDLKTAFSIFSKSSPYAVSTERSPEYDVLAAYKSYIYIQTNIEEDFKQTLLSSKSDQIIFLCGSSGDGKSEILTRYSQKHKTTHSFHLDATHSFNPSETAINALDELFTQFKLNNKPLIIGINIGMMGNYAGGGSDEHRDIKNSIQAFIEKNKSNISPNHIFLDFEQYPKFAFSEKENTSDFIEKFLIRLTDASPNNPFYILYSSEVRKLGRTILTTNYELLSHKSIQKNIIDLLIKARLIKDQFLTARTLLDFIYQILTLDDYIFNNLFSGADNELLQHIQSFDPNNIHTQKIDEFILQFGLGIEDSGFVNFKMMLADFGIYDLKNAASYLRAAYLLKENIDIEHDYISDLYVNFESSLVETYSKNWLSHRYFDGAAENKIEINKFYRHTLISALHKYCNRNAPSLDKNQFFISEYNGFKIAVELEIEPDLTAIQTKGVTKIGAFNAYLKIDNTSIPPISININLLSLLLKINKGYRPNKHDKNTVILLDEIIDHIVTIANDKNSLFFIKNDNRYKIVNKYNEYYEVSGM